MSKKLEVRPSGEVGFVDGYMMAVVYPVPECPQSKAERDYNVKRMVDSWNSYDALQSLNAELLADLEVAAAQLRKYETLHRAKGTDDSLTKAEVNAALAARFEETIAKTRNAQ